MIARKPRIGALGGKTMPERSGHNPLIKISDVPPSRDDFEVIGVFNAAAVEKDGRTFLLLRVAERPVQNMPGKAAVAAYSPEEGGIKKIYFDKDDPGIDCSDPRTVVTPRGNYITSMGHLRGAWSDDGVNFAVEERPFLKAGTCLEKYGIEDPRITFIDGEYRITYSAISDDGIATALAFSRDLVSAEKKGIIFMSRNKNIVIFPEKTGGLYRALHRPFNKERARECIWIASSPDLIHWGCFKKIAVPGPSEWDIRKIGPGAPPIRTPEGWLEIYHGVDSEERYSLGVLLLDLNDPSRVIGRSRRPFLMPEEPYETGGLVKNVVFTCGAVRRDDGRIDIYYGASDDCVCLATASEEELLRSVKA
ncbi:MAG: glycosidase [Candidatus Omnitrophica bacterium]|nr:glycosidase [Candidatus Omnitrophota bacterium]